MSHQPNEDSPYLAAQGCEDGVTMLRSKLQAIPAPTTKAELEFLERYVTRNGTVVSIIASLNDAAIIRQDIARLTESLKEPDLIDDCRKNARDLMLHIGIPIQKELAATSKDAAKPPVWDLRRFLPGALRQQS